MKIVSFVYEDAGGIVAASWTPEHGFVLAGDPDYVSRVKVEVSDV